MQTKQNQTPNSIGAWILFLYFFQNQTKAKQSKANQNTK